MDILPQNEAKCQFLLIISVSNTIVSLLGQKARRGRTGLQNPSTLYGAPPTAIGPLAEYGASAPALPSYGSDTLPSYGNRRSASNVVPVYVPGPLTAPLISAPAPHRGGPLRAPRYNNQHNV